MIDDAGGDGGGSAPIVFSSEDQDHISNLYGEGVKKNMQPCTGDSQRRADELSGPQLGQNMHAFSGRCSSTLLPDLA